MQLLHCWSSYQLEQGLQWIGELTPLGMAASVKIFGVLT